MMRPSRTPSAMMRTVSFQAPGLPRAASCVPGEHGVKAQAEQHLRPVHIAHPCQDVLLHELQGNVCAAFADPARKLRRVAGQVVQGIRAQLAARRSSLGRREDLAGGGPAQIGPAVVRDEADTHSPLGLGRAVIAQGGLHRSRPATSCSPMRRGAPMLEAPAKVESPPKSHAP